MPPGDEADPEAIERAVRVLREGGVILYPTETFYALGANAEDPEAIERVRSLKGREGAKPFPLLVPDRATLAEWVEGIPPAAERLMDRFWPGPLTLVLKASRKARHAASAEGSVGVRLPAHPVAQALLRGFGSAVIATSANRSGRPSPRTLAEARSEIPRVEAVLDGGTLPGRLGSTVVDLTRTPPRLVRAGDLPPSEVWGALA